MRVLAVDGSTFVLPEDRKGLTAKEYGRQSCGNVIARVSALYDVLNKVFIEATLEDYQISEQELALVHTNKIQKGDLVLFDRGYASRMLMATLLHRGAHFLFRMSGHWNIVQDIKQKKVNSSLYTIELTKEEQRSYPELPAEFTLRLVKRKLKDGRTAVFATNLLDEKKYKNSAITDLYWKRWQVEESYKFMKKRIEVENWTGLLPVCHEQDFGTSIALSNLTACLASCVVPPPAPRTGRKRKRKPKERKAQVNMRRVMESGKDLLKGLARRNLCKDLLNMTLEYLKTCYDWIDPGRQNERNIKKTPVKSPTGYG